MYNFRTDHMHLRAATSGLNKFRSYFGLGCVSGKTATRLFASRIRLCSFGPSFCSPQDQFFGQNRELSLADYYSYIYEIRQGYSRQYFPMAHFKCRSQVAEDIYSEHNRRSLQDSKLKQAIHKAISKVARAERPEVGGLSRTPHCLSFSTNEENE